MTAPLDNDLLAEILMTAWEYGFHLQTVTTEMQRHLDALIAEGLIADAGGHLYGGAGEEARARKRYAELRGVRSCARCHCTDDWACDGGCWWAAPDLCSRCVQETA